MLRVIQGEQCARVTGADRTALNHLLPCVWQRQHSKQICDSRSILPHRLGNLLLRQPKFFNQLAIPARLFDRVQVRPLQIFDERKDEHRAIVEVAHNRGDFRPAEVRGGSTASLTGDELESVALAANGYRLKQSARLERGLELGQLCGIELTPWLIRILTYATERDPLKIAYR